jgi:hypothetical protein
VGDEGAEVVEGSQEIRVETGECPEMRGFHDLLREKPSSLFILFGWNSVSIASDDAIHVSGIDEEDGGVV